MSTQADRWQLSRCPYLLDRIQMNLVQFAQTVLQESNVTTGHAQRVDLANRVLADSPGYAARMAVGIVQDANISPTAPEGAGITDQILDGAVQAVWNAFAGVSS